MKPEPQGGGTDAAQVMSSRVLLASSRISACQDLKVLAPGGESVWRWSDRFKTALRIHTKEIGVVTW